MTLERTLPNLRFWGSRRLQTQLQTEAAECGLACLAMVAGYLGLPHGPA